MRPSALVEWRKKRNIGGRASAEELFGNAYLLPCNNPESLPFGRVQGSRRPDTFRNAFVVRFLPAFVQADVFSHWSTC